MVKIRRITILSRKLLSDLGVVRNTLPLVSDLPRANGNKTLFFFATDASYIWLDAKIPSVLIRFMIRNDNAYPPRTRPCILQKLFVDRNADSAENLALRWNETIG